MSADRPEQPSPAAERFDRAKVRLFAILERSCNPRLAFAEQLETSLAAVLELFALEPELRRLLTWVDFGDPGVAARHQFMVEALSEMLRQSARQEPEVGEQPTFVEPFLILGISCLIGRYPAGAERLDQDRLLLDLVNYVLPYYVGNQQLRGQTRRPARSALSNGNGSLRR